MQENKKVLIVEDEKSLRKVLVKKLIKEKFDILEAKDGLDGLDKAIEHHPDLILLDIIMPVMDGITMLKKLRSDKWGKEVPVIILTNLVDAGKTQESLEQGVYDFLVKSDWKIDDVIKKVNNRLK